MKMGEIRTTPNLVKIASLTKQWKGRKMGKNMKIERGNSKMERIEKRRNEGLRRKKCGNIKIEIEIGESEREMEESERGIKKEKERERTHTPKEDTTRGRMVGKGASMRNISEEGDIVRDHR